MTIFEDDTIHFFPAFLIRVVCHYFTVDLGTNCQELKHYVNKRKTVYRKMLSLTIYTYR